MPRTKKGFAKIRTQSKKIIMETSLELFATRGFHNTSISQIAKTAGVSKGLMYNYFNSKDDLLKAILLGAYEESAEMITKKLDSPDTPQEQLEQIIQQVLFTLKNKSKHWKLITALSFQEDAKHFLRKDLKPKQEAIIQQFTRIFKEMGYDNPLEEAYLVGGMLDGMSLNYMTIGEAYPIDKISQFLIQRYCL